MSLLIAMVTLRRISLQVNVKKGLTLITTVCRMYGKMQMASTQMMLLMH